jgi:hypothetical protein
MMVVPGHMKQRPVADSKHEQDCCTKHKKQHCSGCWNLNHQLGDTNLVVQFHSCRPFSTCQAWMVLTKTCLPACQCAWQLLAHQVTSCRISGETALT